MTRAAAQPDIEGTLLWRLGDKKEFISKRASRGYAYRCERRAYNLDFAESSARLERRRLEFTMNLGRIARRGLEKASRTAYSIAGIDSITGMRVPTRRVRLQHVGSRHAGWTVPIELLLPRAVCYCVGCGEDISFDMQLIRDFGCTVFGFDPTPRAIVYVREQTKTEPNYHFSDVGLWSSADNMKFFAPKDPAHVSHSLLNLQKTGDYFEARVDRLGAIMRANGHGSIDLLKLDVEGAEYAVLDSILEDDLDIKVLCVEYDEYFSPLDEEFAGRIKDSVLRLIDARFDLVFSKGNGNYTFLSRSYQTSL